MKPDGDTSFEMDLEPGRLFVELGMLVVDGRQPDLSVKGRIEGPHCMPSASNSHHVCQSRSEQCVEAAQFQTDMEKLWRNCIPMCIEVVMCQDCEIGDAKHDCHDCPGVLLERWTISALSCRMAEVYMSGQGLLQAVRSYLYFSQLSAWLNSSQGSEPRKIIYRVSAPGESYSTSFSHKPDDHMFPVARTCKSTGIQVMVTALPRCGHTPQVVSQSVSPPKRKYFKPSDNEEGRYSINETRTVDKNVNTKVRDNTSSVKRRINSEQECENENSLKTVDCSQNEFSQESLSKKRMQCGGAIPKQRTQSDRSKFSLPVKSNQSGYQTLESPKVLFTYNSLSDSWYRYENDCFSLAEDLTDLESDLSKLQLNSDIKQCKTTGKTDLSLKELNLLPEESRVKFSIGHSPITLSPHRQNIEVRNVSKEMGLKNLNAVRQLSFDQPIENNEAPTSPSNAKHDLINTEASDNNNHQNGTNSRQFETPSTSSLFDKKLSKLSKNLQDHFEPASSLKKSQQNGAAGDHTETSPNFNKSKSLLNSVMKKEATNVSTMVSCKPIPTADDKASYRRSLDSSTALLFHAQTGLPMQSSPAPVKKRSANGQFGYDGSLNNIKAIKKVISCSKLELDDKENSKDRKYISTSAPASTNCLLGNFEESLLNGRLEPAGVLDGFSAEIGASGSFCPKHIRLPVTAYFFSLSDDNAPSPYLGHINLSGMGRRGYHVPKKGTVQVTLFNPEGAVVKMFVVMYDLTDMPANSQTFLRQRTFYMPVVKSARESANLPSYLRYLIHLRYSSSKTGKIYLHTDVRLIFSRDKFEFDSRIATYELRSFTDRPENPKYSPKR